MASNPKELLNKLMQTEGALCAALVDYNSGMLLESVGTGVDLEMAAAGNTEVVRAKMKTMKSLGLNDEIEDILRPVYGSDTGLWMRRWRWFFLATSGLFGYADGSEWGVSHFRMKKG